MTPLFLKILQIDLFEVFPLLSIIAVHYYNVSPAGQVTSYTIDYTFFSSDKKHPEKLGLKDQMEFIWVRNSI